MSGEIVELIEKAGGEILVSRLWEERRLAYPIKGQRKGTYWLTYFRLDGRQGWPGCAASSRSRNRSCGSCS